MFHELQSRDREDGCATWQPHYPKRPLTVRRRVSELVLSGAEGRTEDARKDGHIHGRSPPWAEFMKYPGSAPSARNQAQGARYKVVGLGSVGFIGLGCVNDSAGPIPNQLIQSNQFNQLNWP